MSVICRFRVNSVEAQNWGTKVELGALYSLDQYEDDEVLAEIRSFYEATPNGQLSMTIKNEAAEKQFQVGDEFYIRLEKIPTDKTMAAINSQRQIEWEAEQQAKKAGDDSDAT